jgi:hypothetical protein
VYNVLYTVGLFPLCCSCAKTVALWHGRACADALKEEGGEGKACRTWKQLAEKVVEHISLLFS